MILKHIVRSHEQPDILRFSCFAALVHMHVFFFFDYSDQIEVLWSKGVKPLPPLHPLLIKGRNLYRLKTLRQVCAIRRGYFFVNHMLMRMTTIKLILIVNFRDGTMKGRGMKFWWKSTWGVLLLGQTEKHGSKRRKRRKGLRRKGTLLVRYWK